MDSDVWALVVRIAKVILIALATALVLGIGVGSCFG